jgi:choice-of-anchor C domain-containing protein
MTRKFGFVILLLTALVFVATGAQANLVSNPSFETGIDPGSFKTIEVAGTDITGWSVVGASVDYIGSYWTAADGTRSIDLSGKVGDAGSLSQAISGLSAGTTYYVTFALAGNNDGPPDPKTVRVDVGGYSGTFTSPKGIIWVDKTFNFISPSTDVTLTFTSLDNTGFGPALDNVRMNAVPLPGAVLLLGAGLARLTAYSRRQRS